MDALDALVGKTPVVMRGEARPNRQSRDQDFLPLSAQPISRYGSANQAETQSKSRSRLNSRGDPSSPLYRSPASRPESSHNDDLSELLSNGSSAPVSRGRSKSYWDEDNTTVTFKEPVNTAAAPAVGPAGTWGFTGSRANQDIKSAAVAPPAAKKQDKTAAAQDDEPNLTLLPSSGQKREPALMECENCGRTFKRQPFEVHQKVCQKVFGEKAAAARPATAFRPEKDKEGPKSPDGKKPDKAAAPAAAKGRAPSEHEEASGGGKGVWVSKSDELRNKMRAAKKSGIKANAGLDDPEILT